MTIWHPDLSQLDGPKYRAIADAIEAAIARGELAPGDRLPPQRNLAWELGVTVGTVSRAYALAEQRQLVAGTVGRGTFVCGGAPAGGAPRAPLPSEEDDTTDLSFNTISSDTATTALGGALEGIRRSPDLAAMLGYTAFAGRADQRAVAARWIGRSGLAAEPASIIPTTGAQLALSAAFDALTQPVRHVFVERLTYPVLKRIAAHRGIRMTGIPLDSGGMVPEALDAAARAAPDVRAVFMVPTLQNPVAATMDTERRRAVAEVARARNLVIVEDDVYGYVAADRPPPIATYAPERTLYVTSISKCLAPGLRVGWLVAPPEWYDRIADAAYATTLTQPPLTHEIVRRWFDDGTAGQLVEELRGELAIRHRMTAEAFAGFDYIDDPASPHILLPLPDRWRSDDFVAAVLAKGYRLAPVEAFAVGPDPVAPAIRLSLAAVRERTTLAGCLTAIREVLDGRPSAERMII